MPGYGRLEIQPPANRKLPQPAQSYHKSWSVQSAQQPAQSDVPYYPPPVIVAPENGALRFAAGFPRIEITGNFATKPLTQPRKQVDRRE